MNTSKTFESSAPRASALARLTPPLVLAALLALTGCVEGEGAADAPRTWQQPACPDGFSIGEGLNGDTIVTEGGTDDMVSIAYCTSPGGSVTVTLTASMVDGDDEVTLDKTSLSFNNGNFSTAQDVVITAIDDSVDENGPDTVTISLDDGQGTTDSFEVTVNDNDNADVLITESGGNTAVVEGGAGDSYMLVLATPPLNDVDVDIAVSDGQCTLSASTVTFTTGNWDTPQAVDVDAVDDMIAEGSHSCTITHTVTSTDPAYDGLTVGNLLPSITDNDSASVTIVESGDSTDVTEGGREDSYTVVLDSEPTDSVTIELNFDDAQLDVSPSSLTFTTGNWDDAQTVTVSADDDPDIEANHPDEDITHSATSNDSNYATAMIADVTVSITDNDTAEVIIDTGNGVSVAESGGTDSYSLVLASRPVSNVTVAVSPDGQVSVGGTTTVVFERGTWDTPQDVTVSAVDDDVDEANSHSGSISHSVSSGDGDYNGLAVDSVSVTVDDDDTADISLTEVGGDTNLVEGGGTETLRFVLGSQPTGNVTITLSADAQLNLTQTTVEFTPSNWDSPKTVPVAATDDNDAEASPHTGTISFSVASTDGNYDGFSISSLDIDITDNDVPGLIFSPARGQTSEGGDTATFNLRLATRPSQDVTVNIVSSHTTEGTVNVASLTFSKNGNGVWNEDQQFVVTGVDDETADGDFNYTIDLDTTSSDNDYDGLSETIDMVNLDDDAANVVVSPNSGLVTTEGSGTATFNISLTSLPTADVSIDLSSDTTAEGRVNMSTVTLDSTNWEVGVTVTVTGVDDFVDDGDIAYTIISDAAVSDDDNYDGINPSDISVINEDNDVPAISIDNVDVTEGDTGTVVMVFDVSMSPPSTRAISVNWATRADTAEAGSDFEGADDTITFNASDTMEQIVINAIGDNLTEDRERLFVDLSSPSGGATLTNTSGRGRINDDDATPVAESGSSTVDEEGTLNGQLSASDGDSDPLTWSIVSNGTKGSVSLTNADNGSFRYEPGANENGSDSFTFRVTDGTNTSSAVSYTVDITPINDAPTVTADATRTANEGSAITLTATANDVEDRRRDLTLRWDFDEDGDFDDATGNSVEFRPADGPAEIDVRVQVSDTGEDNGVSGSPLTATATTTVTVSNIPPALSLPDGNVINGDEGSSITLGVVGQDPGADTLSYDWDFGDGDTMNNAGATVQHVFAEQQRYTVSVDVDDGDGGTDSIVLTANIINVEPTFINPNPETFVQQDTQYVYEAHIRDPGTEDVITWLLLDGPEGMMLDDSPCDAAGLDRCRRLIWSPTDAQSQQLEPFSVSLRVTDDDGGANVLSWEINANFLDTDNGGAPDLCEDMYPELDKTNPDDDDLDPDMDGLTTEQECLSGTNPIVPNTPNAPAPYAPVDFQVLSEIPLTVTNAVDPDGESLTYEYEVISMETNEVVWTVSDVAETSFRTTSPLVDVSGLSEDGRYWWRARASDANGTGPWSEDRMGEDPITGWQGSFIYSSTNNFPQPPTPVSPIGVTADVNVSLVVDNGTDPENGVLTYEFELLDDENLDVVAAADDVAEGADGQTSWEVPVTLIENSTYRWRARVYDERGIADGSSEMWSETVTFRVDSSESAPEVPVILFPEPGANVIFSSIDDVVIVALGDEVDPDNEPVTYTFSVDGIEVSGLSVDDAGEVAADGAMFEGLTLTDNTTYEVEVYGVDTGGNVGESATTTFRYSESNDAPGVPMIVSPGDGTTISTVVPSLVWMHASDVDGDALTYDVGVSRDAEFTDPVFEASGIETNGEMQSTLTTPALEVSTTYHWRVRAVDNSGADNDAGPWTEPAAFFISLVNEAPGIPALISPTQGEVLPAGEPVTMSWESVIDPEGAEVTYRLEVFDASDERVVAESGLVDDGTGTVSFTVDALEAGGYTWRVQASDGAQSGIFSPTGAFGVAVEVPEPFDSDTNMDDDEVDPPRYPKPLGEGCGCSVPSSRAPLAPLTLLVGALGVVVWLRRRRS